MKGEMPLGDEQAAAAEAAMTGTGDVSEWMAIDTGMSHQGFPEQVPSPACPLLSFRDCVCQDIVSCKHKCNEVCRVKPLGVLLALSWGVPDFSSFSLPLACASTSEPDHDAVNNSLSVLDVITGP